jgi:aspartate carbamoyltransferase catalytic subunit
MVARVPVINAGEPSHRAALGSAQHPTQALTDVATIERALGTIDGLHVVVVPGDGASLVIVQSLSMLLGRVCRSLRLTLTVRPALVPLFDELSEYLRAQGVRCEINADLRRAVPDADVLYFAQANNLHLGVAERYQAAGAAPGVFVLTPEVLDLLPDRAIVMHPLPRNIGASSTVPAELSEEFTDDPRVRCFEQAQMKHVVAGALLYLLLAR